MEIEMDLSKERIINAFAMIVDINGYTPMIANAKYINGIAQFVRDVLVGGIEAVEKNNGVVVGFMGDAFLAVFDNPDSVLMTCSGIAKDLDRLCEYLASDKESCPDNWEFHQGGPGLKIAVEYGWIDISTIWSSFLGEQKLLAGTCINYANRISNAGIGNRCLIGPQAMKEGMNMWSCEGPFTIAGKNGEGDYTYWQLDLSDVWVEGVIEPDEDKFWG